MVSDVNIRTRAFVKATVQGLDDLASCKEALRQLVGATPALPDVHLFVDVRGSPADLSLSEITDLVASFNQSGLGSGRKTALLVDDHQFDKGEFFAVSARGRGNEVQAFSAFEDACEWLTYEP